MKINHQLLFVVLSLLTLQSTFGMDFFKRMFTQEEPQLPTTCLCHYGVQKIAEINTLLAGGIKTLCTPKMEIEMLQTLKEAAIKNAPDNPHIEREFFDVFSALGCGHLLTRLEN